MSDRKQSILCTNIIRLLLQKPTTHLSAAFHFSTVARSEVMSEPFRKPRKRLQWMSVRMYVCENEL